MSKHTVETEYTTDEIRNDPDVADTDAEWWQHPNGQHEIPLHGHTFKAALAELLGQCSTDEQRRSIEAGSWWADVVEGTDV